MTALRTALALVAGAALLVACAKTHGRQVRLRREQQGHFRVEFGGDNPPEVEALWRADRWRFWGTFAVLAAVGAALFVAGRRGEMAELPVPWPAAAALFLGWSMAGAFLVAGASWAVDVARAARRGAPAPAGAGNGTLAWFGVDAVLALAQAATLAL